MVDFTKDSFLAVSPYILSLSSMVIPFIKRKKLCISFKHKPQKTLHEELLRFSSWLGILLCPRPWENYYWVEQIASTELERPMV